MSEQRSISFYELLSTEWPEEVFIEGGLLSRGDTMLIGCESKGGKTTLLNDLRKALITGGAFLGFKVPKPLKVLSLQAELREGRLKERIKPTYTDIPEDFLKNSHTWATKNRVLFCRDDEAIHNECERLRPDVIEIDPMINFHSFNENNAQDMATFFRSVDRLKDTFNVSILMAQHFRKNTDPKAKISLLDMIRGSTAIRGWASTTIAMEGRTPTEYRELAIETRNSDEAIKRIIKYNSKTKSFDWNDPVAIVGAWALEFLGNNGTNYTTTMFTQAIMERHGNLFSHNHQKVFEVKQILLRTNLIKETQQGKCKFVSRC